MEEGCEGYEPLQECHAQNLIKKAIEDVEQLVKASSLTRDSSAGAIAEFDFNEVEIGPLLGAGGFARVHEVWGFHPNSRKEVTAEAQAARDFFVQHATRESGECRFAIKHLKRNLVYQPEKFASGVMDLAMEAHLMSALDHPNIVKVRGVAAAGLGALVDGQFDEYFIIVDKLNETLDDRIGAWKKRQKRLNRRRPFIKRAQKNSIKRKQLLLEQLGVGLEIASAVEYLHGKGVIHRDIKASNCGFDAHGDCKLFDFGLAAEIITGFDGEPCLLYENVGSKMYMAPEVANGDGYDVKADVYSYAMTLYEILTLARPWSKFNTDRKKNVEDIILSVDEELYESPSVCSSWPVAIQGILKRAWSQNSSERPSMAEFCHVLRIEIGMLQEDIDPSAPTKKPCARRRSSFSGYLSSLNELVLAELGALSPKDSANTCATTAMSSGNYIHDF